MVQLAAGDDLVLNELMARWRDKIGAFIFRMTGDQSATMDLTQETFVRLYQNKHRYQPSAPFSTYLFTIAANLARNHFRWKSRHPSVLLEESEAYHRHQASPDLSPDASAERHDLRDAIHAAITALPRELREAFILFTYDEMSQAEIGAIIGCSAKAVETRIYRARQLLKESLRDVKL